MKLRMPYAALLFSILLPSLLIFRPYAFPLFILHRFHERDLLPQAVANQTSATFLRVVGSELIQKYLGDGPKLVRELFRVAEEHAPAIVFIDEIDAVGTKRRDIQADRFARTHTLAHVRSRTYVRIHTHILIVPHAPPQTNKRYFFHSFLA